MAFQIIRFLTEVWLCILVCHITFALSESGRIGDTDQIPNFLVITTNDPDGLYLNTERPATCNGTISLLEYCYYGQIDQLQNTYRSLIAVYRLVNQSQYVRVSETISVTRRSYPFPLTSQADDFLTGFNCDSQRLSPSVKVLAGDIVGICIYNSGGTSELDMITFRPGGYRMMFEGIGRIRCDTGEMPLVVGDRLEIDSFARVLHISAEITPMNIEALPLPTEAESTITTPTLTEFEVAPSNDPIFLVSTVGGASLGLLFLIVMVVIIMNIVIVVSRRKKNRSTVSATNLVSRDYTIGGSEYDIPHPYLRAEAVFVHEQSQPMECSQYYNNSNESYTTCSSLPWRHPYFTLEGPNYSYDELLAKNKVQDIYANVAKYRVPATQETELYGQLTSCGVSIDRGSIQVLGHLGSGQFGSVEKGVWRIQNHQNMHVALKTLNQSSTTENRMKFLQEAAIMAQFRHPNVILLYGIISNDEPITLVVQLADKGDLKKYLWKLRPNPGQLPDPNLPNLLLSFSQHVALGMQYLSGKGFVHRDLAARNVLVSKDNICKIADFGLSRDLMNDNYYVSQGGKIPVKWTAPEALDYKKYSTASDVWSYGCLLYEIWSLGHNPFDNEKLSNRETIWFVRERKRSSPPPGCPRAIYDLMIQCWHPTTAERPRFRSIHLCLCDNLEDVLSIPQEALDTHQLAGVLGAPLKAGERMYENLKKKYEEPM